MPTQKKKSTIHTRISLRRIVETISRFSREQLAAIESIGLGGLKHLRCTRVDHNLCEWLVKNFDPAECSLTAHGRKLLVTPLDVQNIMGVSCQGDQVSREGPSTTIAEMSEKYGFKGGLVSLKNLREDIEAMDEVGDDFKVRFVLLALGCIFCPSLRPYINQNFLHSLVDTTSLSKINWAKLVLDYLVNVIHNYKENKQAGVSGCLLFLMLFSFENFIPLGLPPSTNKTPSYPLIGMWGNEEVNSRIRFLRKKGLFTKEKIALVTRKENTIKAEPRKGSAPFEKADEAIGLETRMKKVEYEVVQIKGNIQGLKDGLNSLQVEFVHIVSLVNKLIAHGEQQQEKQHGEQQHGAWYSPLSGDEKGIRGDHKARNGSSPRPVDETSDPVDELSSRPPVPKKRKYPAAKGLENPLPLRRSPPKKAVSKREGEHSVRSKFPRTRVQDIRLPSKYRRSPYTAGTVKQTKRAMSVAVFEGHDLQKVEQILCDPPPAEHVRLLRDNPPTIEHTLPRLTEEENNVVNYVLDNSQTLNEIIVRYDLEAADRATLLSLGVGQWVTDMGRIQVINLAVVKLTWEERSRHPDGKCTRWYLPTYFSIIIPTAPSITDLSRSYFGDTRYTTDIGNVDKIFIPVNDANSHWFLCVIDFTLSRAFILDPMPSPAKNKAHEQMVVKIVNFMDLLLTKHYGADYRRPIVLFEHQRLGWIPQQENGDDCGVFVIMYMELLDLNPRTKFMFGSKEDRQRTLADLVTTKHNKNREEVLQKVATYISQQG